jgi:predicted ATPase/DNA-binding SARP family transcriptional activator
VTSPTSEKRQNGPVPFELHVIGTFRAKVNGKPLAALRSRKSEWLLALLAIRHKSALDRHWVASRLWPDSTEDRGLAALRTTLNDLRRALGSESWRVQSPTSRTLRLAVHGASVDIVAMDAILDRGEIDSLVDVDDLLKGSLLEGCSETWLMEEWHPREMRLVAILEDHAHRAGANGNRKEAINSIRRVLSLEPINESAVRFLMTMEAESGSPSAAIEAYRELRDHLRAELRAEPDAETRRVLDKIRERMRTPQANSNPKLPDFAIPRPITSLVGRRVEVAAIVDKIRENRLVTISGTGGVGKTRIALEIAHFLKSEFSNGCCFVELAPLSNPTLLPTVVAEGLQIRTQPRLSIDESLFDSLRTADLVLILDNCEHLLDASARFVEKLLTSCGGVRIVATSREPLGITGEVRWKLSPLTLPPDLGDGSAQTSPEVVKNFSRYEALELLVERAAQVDPEFSLNSRNLATIVEICRKLDGIPLALELAAAHFAAMSPKEIAEKLENRLGLLCEGSRTASARHQTLRGVLDWSYDLLSNGERELFARLSVFAGNWTIECAISVCADQAVAAGEVREIVSSLVSRNMVELVRNSDEPIYRLLETVKEYSKEKLLERGQTDDFRDRHLGYYLNLATEANKRSTGPDQAIWLRKISRELDNVRIALARSLEVAITQDPEENVALRFTSELHRFWYRQGDAREGREWYRRALESDQSMRASEYRAIVIGSAGGLAYEEGDYDFARSCFQEALQMANELGHPIMRSSALLGLSSVAGDEGDLEGSRTLIEEALASIDGLDEDYRRGVMMARLGLTAQEQGHFEEAEEIHRRRLELDRRIGHKAGEGGSLNNLAYLARVRGDYDDSSALYKQAIQTSYAAGDLAEVEDELKGLALLQLAVKKSDQAALMFGASETLRLSKGTTLRRCGRPERVGLGALIRNQMDEVEFGISESTGRQMNLAEAIEFALGIEG